jgi:hypothetical protein
MLIICYFRASKDKYASNKMLGHRKIGADGVVSFLLYALIFSLVNGVLGRFNVFWISLDV